MGPAVARLYAAHGSQLGEDELQEAALLQQHETDGGHGREDNLVELVDDALAGNNLDALRHAAKALEGFLLDLEVELRGKTHAAHHAQRVVGEGDVGIERRGNDAVLQVVEPVVHIHQTSVARLSVGVGRVVEADGEGVDGEVAPADVVLQRAVLHDGFARVVGVALAAGADKLHLGLLTGVAPFDLRRAEVAEDGERGASTETFLEGLGHFDAAAHHHDVDVLGGALQEEVAHVAAHDVAVHPQPVGRTPYGLEEGTVLLAQQVAAQRAVAIVGEANHLVRSSESLR